MDQVHQFDLPPSTRLTDYEVTKVLGNLLQLRAIDYNSITEHIKTKHQHWVKKQADPTEEQAREVDSFAKTFKRHLDATLYIRSKEASGYAILGIFSEFVREMMHKKYPSLSFKIEPEFRVCEGKQYASDQCLMQLLTVTEDNKVLVLWEYKPRVPASLDDITGWHLSETLLQAYYMRKKHSYPVLHCLTDLTDFHYFFIEDNRQRTLKIVQYAYLCSELVKPDHVWDHMEFLFQSIHIIDADS